jgi:hypothetical protein
VRQLFIKSDVRFLDNNVLAWSVVPIYEVWIQPNRFVREKLGMFGFTFEWITATNRHGRAFTRSKGVEYQRDVRSVVTLEILQDQRRSVPFCEIPHQRLQLVGTQFYIERHLDALELPLFVEQVQIFTKIFKCHRVSLRD